MREVVDHCVLDLVSSLELSLVYNGFRSPGAAQIAGTAVHVGDVESSLPLADLVWQGEAGSPTLPTGLLHPAACTATRLLNPIVRQT